jgi:hypothetical protein
MKDFLMTKKEIRGGWELAQSYTDVGKKQTVEAVKAGKSYA